MPSTRDIRRRIKSVKNTAQITKAMQMVASSKMRKAQLAALAGRPYANLMNSVLANVSDGAKDFTHPLLESNSNEPFASRAWWSVISLFRMLWLDLTGQISRHLARL